MDLAWRLASTLRDQAGLPATESLAQMLLQEFSLSSEEGIALMCLAESVLRIPDTATQDALIRDKISKGRWSAHLGHSPSPFVNAAIWGLLLTGRLYAAHQGRACRRPWLAWWKKAANRWCAGPSMPPCACWAISSSRAAPWNRRWTARARRSREATPIPMTCWAKPP